MKLLLVSVFVSMFSLLVEDALAGSSHRSITPTKKWTKAPDDFLKKRWNINKLKEVEKHWNEMHKKKMSSALMVVDSGFVVLRLGKVDKPLRCHSVRKSFLNALFGVLHTEKKLDLSQTLGELKIDDRTALNAQEKKARIGDLLKCRSGVYLPAEFETSGMKEKKPKRGSFKRDEYYYYNNWDFNALGGIYRKLTSSDLFKDFSMDIANPIGMQDFDYKRDCRYWHDSADDLKSQFPAYRFKMSVRDQARFGLLFLQRGMWNGQTVLTDEWIKISTTAYSNHRSDPKQLGAGSGYGLLWWISDTGWLFGQKFNGQPYSARGNRGQFIGVVPSEKLVVAHANDSSIKGAQWSRKERNKLMQLIKSAMAAR